MVFHIENLSCFVICYIYALFKRETKCTIKVKVTKYIFGISKPYMLHSLLTEKLHCFDEDEAIYYS